MSVKEELWGKPETQPPNFLLELECELSKTVPQMLELPVREVDQLRLLFVEDGPILFLPPQRAPRFVTQLINNVSAPTYLESDPTRYDVMIYNNVLDKPMMKCLPKYNPVHSFLFPPRSSTELKFEVAGSSEYAESDRKLRNQGKIKDHKSLTKSITIS
ncbi:hypothetical protein CROQUDRAFT_93498 [Cronartium quercuum f. sp. fusiforme G11]|uniref:Uncharacterized protein n=1 Tax=Cronartium quercuum f. sp. fusiforme G11 TaxID=708437 RepID=A0A9P6NGU9_9BASI|nr:hypothetical protein CROQUDRAFT_93498 [Cronartium quercuum f. sp. fusiforme G11]